ncbi:putative sterigmatocystin biosynthesis P450 monooxygenase stcS [Podospora australis]|uniref:Sterigmatocystin biosynthesis P450 monooxygenase stcS n=1 Tax=Podospora australis TaxID=1536484 RepID=A0AAN6WMG2_9PEZI|nr:putative sterigmatocystin biosynthesis P450 monooxygenase stcS [Podospora australis]
MLSNLILLALPLVIGYLIKRIYYTRYRQYAAFPQHKSSFFWGNLAVLNNYLNKWKDTPAIHIDHVLYDMQKDLGSPPIMLLDTRPIFQYPMVVISSHEVAEQVSKSSKLFPWSTPKSPTFSEFVHLIGPRSILTRESDDWKGLRKRYNPGFAPQHLMTLLPCILDKTDIFLDRLDGFCASGKDFSLMDMIVNLTFDIIGAVVMGIDFDAQLHDPSDGSRSQGEFIKRYEELVHAYQKKAGLSWPWWMQPRKEWKRQQLSKEVDVLLKKMIQEKHAERNFSPVEKTTARSVLNLSLQDTETLSEDFLNETVDQIKTFLFAGHDTTSILLSWIFYALARTPSVRKAVNAELDSIFGPETHPAVIRQKLLAPGGEELINRMTYTSAVIKEALRLWPPASTARMAAPGTNFVVTTPEGQNVCLDGLVIYNCAFMIQRDPRVFGETANEFIPERWLGDKSGIMSSSSNTDDQKEGGRRFPAAAWRPFERGPRNCIGQDLATIEARVIIACVSRRYDFTKVGLGELESDEKGRPILEENGRCYKVKSSVHNSQVVTAKPVDGMRMKVRRL